MPNITVDSLIFPVYNTLVTARTYAVGMLGAAAAVWRALTDNEAGRTLLNARMLLDGQSWLGAADNANGDGLQWPRSNCVLADGTTVPSTMVPVGITAAEVELAIMLNASPDLYGQPDGTNNVTRLRIGPLEANYARPPAGAFGERTILPPQIERLIGIYLAKVGSHASKVSGTKQADGTATVSTFDDAQTYDRNRAF